MICTDGAHRIHTDPGLSIGIKEQCDWFFHSYARYVGALFPHWTLTLPPLRIDHCFPVIENPMLCVGPEAQG